MANELEKISKRHSTYYFNAETVTEASAIDGIHLDENQHLMLGEAIAQAAFNTIVAA